MKPIIGLLVAASLMLASPVQAELTAAQLNFIEKVANTFDHNPRMSKDFGKYIRKFKTYACTATPVKRFDESFTQLFFGTTRFYREALALTCSKSKIIMLWRSDNGIASYYIHDREFSEYALNIGDMCSSDSGCNDTEIGGNSFAGSVVTRFQLSGTNLDQDYQTWKKFIDRNNKAYESRQADMQRSLDYEACKRRAYARGSLSGGLGLGC